MNDKEKDLINEQDSSIDTQSINENVSLGETQSPDENVLASETKSLNQEIQTHSNVEEAVNKTTPIENVDVKSEKVNVNNVAPPSKDVLFGGYEVRNWEFSPRIYKIIGTAAVFNLLALFVVAQTNMLATSACESPFVNRVCQVLDTVYVGNKLFQAGNEVGRGEFNPTDFDPEEVVWVPQDGITPPITYPEGYFQIANRDEIAAREAMIVDQENGFSNNPITTAPYTPSKPFTPTQKPSTSRGSRIKSPVYKPYKRKKNKSGVGGADSLLNTKQKVPKGGTIDGEPNDTLFTKKGGDDNKNGENTANKQDPKKDPKKDPNTIAKNTAKDSKAVEDKEITKLPLELYVIEFQDNLAVNEIEIKKPFAVKYQGQLNKDGTFKNIRPVVKNGDPGIVNLMDGGVKALGSSRFLKYLTEFDVENIELTILQNDKEFQAVIISSQKTPEDAKTVASGLNGSISLAKIFKKREINGGEKDELKRQSEIDQLFLLQNTLVTSQGNNFVFTIKLPRSDAQDLIKRSLENEARKREKDKNYGKPDKQKGSATVVKSGDNKGR